MWPKQHRTNRKRLTYLPKSQETFGSRRETMNMNAAFSVIFLLLCLACTGSTENNISPEADMRGTFMCKQFGWIDETHGPAFATGFIVTGRTVHQEGFITLAVKRIGVDVPYVATALPGKIPEVGDKVHLGAIVCQDGNQRLTTPTAGRVRYFVASIE
jgi:hypothetical protein